MSQARGLRRFSAGVSTLAILSWAFAGLPAYAGPTTYSYDAKGRVTSVTYPNGGTITYSYDNAGNRTSVARTHGTNAVPVASNDSTSTAYATAVSLDPRSNDADGDGDTLTITAVSQGGHGAVTFSATSVTYTPATNFSGTDNFTYTISDGNGGTATGTVSVTVSNAAPTAANDSYSTVHNHALTVDPRSNDSDPNNDTLTITGAGSAPHGTTSYTGTSVTYTPTSGYVGSDSFTYSISDGHGGSAAATISVTVTNAAPSASNDSQTTAYNTAKTFDPRSNDTDADSDALTITGVGSAAHGTTSFTGTSVTYTPATNYSGSDSFTYTISDGFGGTATGTVNMTVSAASNAAPVANNDSKTTAFNTAFTIDPRTNDTDADNDTLTVTAAGSASHGTTSFTGTSVTYTPTSGYSGSDSFTYTLSDGHGHTATGTVNVTVSTASGQQPYNGTLTPWAIASSGTTTISALNFDSGGEGVSWHDSDAGNNGTQSRTGIDVDIAPSGTAIGWVNSGEWVEYTINVATTGDYSFSTKEGEQLTGRTVTATFEQNGSVYTTSGAIAVPVSGNWDTHINSSPVTVHLNAGVQVVRLTFGGGDNQDVESFSLTASGNTAPVANTDSYTTAYNLALTADPRSNDTDANNDTLTITGVGSATHGATGFTGTSITYTPTFGYTGSDSFTYTVIDGHGGSATGTVNMTVTAPAQQPYNSNHTPWAIASSGTTTVDAINFDSGGEGISWHDNPGLDNGGQTIRGDTDVEIAPTNVAIGWTGAGEWIEYTINVAQAGTYTFKTSTSTQYDGAYLTATFEQNGSVYTTTGAFAVPNNNDWYHYVSSSGVSVTLNAGIQVVRLTFSSNRADLNNFSLTPSGNAAPVANNDSKTTAFNTAFTIDPRSNDTDADSDTLTITAVGSAAHGTTSFTGTSLTYTPTSGYTGSDSFTYTISDGHSHTATATVSVTVSAPSNVAPVANNDSTTTAFNTAKTLDPRSNDTDADSDTLTVTAVGSASHGTTSFTGTSVTYTPTSGYSGSDSFTYTISDGHSHTATATVSITVASNTDLTLLPEQSLVSALGYANLHMQGDGNLVIYNQFGSAMWATDTYGSGADKAVFHDGNLALYVGSTIIWQTNTGGHPGATLTMGDDGIAVIKDAGGTQLWNSTWWGH